MEMPTPCPSCGETEDLDDMKKCRTCRELFCRSCITRERKCPDCAAEEEEENE